MSELSYLEKLLDGVKVEWKTLEKVLKRTKGTKITAGQMKALHKDNAPLKIFAGGKTVAFVDFKDIPEKDINREPSIIVKSRGIIEFEYYDKPFSHKNEMWSYHSNNDAISIKYIYYFLKINEGYFQKIGGKMQMPQIATPDTDKFEVPIPCPDNPEKSLAIQSEIVRILDKFSELTAELTAELNMRKKQYNYYRDQLFSFKESEVEWKTLGEIGHFTRGKRFVKTDMLSEGYPCIHYGEMYTYYNVWTNKTKSFVSHELASKLRVSEYGDVIIVAAGETIEDIGKGTAWLGKSNVVFHDACFSYRCLLNPKYIAYFTRTKIFHDQIKKHISSGKISAINANGLSKVKIPMLSAKEQARIVDILDKFDTLTNSITEGLPR
ncbi:restriction endonuclease subunit S, partial [Escherichia coli]|uniref:restriction endonuclease subunit S n=1 Tax=Escherichia coli TaxID=562 RepID=UPI001CDA91C3